MFGKVYRWSCFLALCYSVYRLFTGNDVFQTMLFTFLSVLFSAMWYIGIKMKEPAAPNIGSSHPDQPLITLANKASSAPKIPQRLLGVPIAYQYQEVDVAMANAVVQDFRAIHPGELIDFVLEPTNQYDPNAIQLWSNNQLLGYVYRGKMQDMLHDFMKQGHPIYSAVYSVMPIDKKVTYNVGFYRAQKPMARGKALGIGRLTASAGEEAQENITLCDEGDEVEAVFDYEKSRYEVSALGYIGCLPKKLEDYGETSTFVIDEVGETDSGKMYVVVAAYE